MFWCSQVFFKKVLFCCIRYILNKPFVINMFWFFSDIRCFWCIYVCRAWNIYTRNGKKNSNIKSLHLTVRALLTLHMFLMHDSFIDHLIRGTRANDLKYLSESIIMEKFMENFSGFISHMFCDVYCTSSCIFSNDRTCHDSPLFQW